MSTTFHIDAGGLGQALKAHGEKGQKLMKIAAIAAARKFKALLVNRTDDLGITDRGSLKNSWKAEKTEDGAIVFSDCPYAGIIELGARPHAVSIEGQQAIADWAVRKLGVDEKEAKSVAFLICRKIAREGQKPKYLVAGVLPKAQIYFREEIARVMK
jgi:phage gpG-like protein